MKIRGLVFWALVALPACAPDYLDLGYDLPVSTTTSTSTSTGTICNPGVTEACYSGPAGTEGQGICKPGKRTCNAAGTAFGPCAGETLPSKEDCSTAKVDEDCDGVPTCQELAWSRRAGDGDAQDARTVATTADGSVYVGGLFFGSLDFGQFLSSKDSSDAFLVKLDSYGAHVWSRQIGGSGAQSIEVSAPLMDGGVVVAGTFDGSLELPGQTWTAKGQSDVFVLRYQSDGTLAWARQMGGTAQIKLGAVAAGDDGSIAIVGSFNGTLDAGGIELTTTGSFDVFVSKLDAAGNVEWAQRYGDGFQQYGEGAAIGMDGSVVASATCAGTIDFGGGGSAGDFINPDVVIAKLSSSGAHVWSKRFGDVATQIAGPLAVDGTGNVYAAGSFYNHVDFGDGTLTANGTLADLYLTKLDSNGVAVWSRVFGDEAMQEHPHIAVTADGGLFLAAGLAGTVDFGGGPLAGAGATDVFFAHFSGDGTYKAGHRYGDATGQNANAVAASLKGHAILAGSFAGTLDFGTGSLLNSGNYDAFVASVAP